MEILNGTVTEGRVTFQIAHLSSIETIDGQLDYYPYQPIYKIDCNVRGKLHRLVYTDAATRNMDYARLQKEMQEYANYLNKQMYGNDYQSHPQFRYR